MVQTLKVGGYAIPVTPSLLWVRHRAKGYHNGMDCPPRVTGPAKGSWLYARFCDTSQEFFCDVHDDDAESITAWIAEQMSAGAPLIDVDARLAEIAAARATADERSPAHEDAATGRFVQGRWIEGTRAAPEDA